MAEILECNYCGSILSLVQNILISFVLGYGIYDNEFDTKENIIETNFKIVTTTYPSKTNL